MARITVEDCLNKVPNRFELVLLGARRAKSLLKGARPLVDSDNKEVVTALREIASGKVRLGHAGGRCGSSTASERRGYLRKRLLRHPRRPERGERRGDSKGLPQARAQAPSGREPG